MIFLVYSYFKVPTCYYDKMVSWSNKAIITSLNTKLSKENCKFIIMNFGFDTVLLSIAASWQSIVYIYYSHCFDIARDTIVNSTIH